MTAVEDWYRDKLAPMAARENAACRKTWDGARLDSQSGKNQYADDTWDDRVLSALRAHKGPATRYDLYAAMYGRDEAGKADKLRNIGYVLNRHAKARTLSKRSTGTYSGNGSLVYRYEFRDG